MAVQSVESLLGGVSGEDGENPMLAFCICFVFRMEILVEKAVQFQTIQLLGNLVILPPI